MTLHGRLTAMSAIVVGLILASGSLLAFVVMRHQLRGQIDDQLVEQAKMFQQVAGARGPLLPAPVKLPQLPAGAAETVPYAQIIGSDGVRVSLTRAQLPVTSDDRAVARGGGTRTLTDRTVGGRSLRVITAPVAGGALQLARPLGSVQSALSRLRLVLAILTVGGVAVAAAASRLLSRRVLAPIEGLSRATEHIRATGDLGLRVDDQRPDEVGRLAASFNAMLSELQSVQDALTSSVGAQRQLVADASHELRTPVASLRTNIEVLLSSDSLDPDVRRALLADVVEQTEELTSVVSDLIDLARGDQPHEDVEDLDLADIARAALARAERHAPQLRYRADIRSWPMTGSRERLGRAINNLLDNAAKYGPPGSTVDLSLRDGVLIVRDEGPGVADEDLPSIFDRFFRARDAARHHGSGLGLAIVQQVVQSHGGQVAAQRADGGGLEITMRFRGA